MDLVLRKNARPDIEFKRFEFEVKTIGEDGNFTGYASTFGNTDQGNDVVVGGAFKRSIDHKGGVVPILWQHDPDQPIGWNLSAKEDDHGLFVNGQLLLEDPLAKKAREFMQLGLKVGAKVGLSIGYKVIKKETKNGIRYLKELKLIEYSVVTFPMNVEAEVTGVKAEEETTMTIEEKAAAEAAAATAAAEAKAKAAKEPGHFAAALQEVSDYSDPYHERSKRSEALSNALWRIRRGDATTDEKKKSMRAARHDHADSMSDMDDAEMDKAAAKKAAEDAELETKSAEERAQIEAKKKVDKKTLMMHKLMMAREYHKQGIKAHDAAIECMKDMDDDNMDAPDGGGDTGTSSFRGAISLKKGEIYVLSYDGACTPEQLAEMKKSTDALKEKHGVEFILLEGGLNLVSATEEQKKASEAATKSEPTENKKNEATTEDPDLLHSIREGLKSMDLKGNDSQPEINLHSFLGNMSSLLD